MQERWFVCLLIMGKTAEQTTRPWEGNNVKWNIVRGCLKYGKGKKSGEIYFK